MSCMMYSISKAIARLRLKDPTLQWISGSSKRYTNEDLVELFDCLLAYPDAIIYLYLDEIQISDEIGIKLARFIAISTVIDTLSLRFSRISEATYLAIAMALRINTSLRTLWTYDYRTLDRTKINSAFVDALILNPNRPDRSHWTFPTTELDNDYYQLKKEAERLGHPNMQALMATQLVRMEMF